MSRDFSINKDSEFEERRRRDEQRQRQEIESGRLTPYDLAVGELTLSLALSEMNGMIFGSQFASGIGHKGDLLDSMQKQAMEDALRNAAERAREGDKGAMSVCGAALFTFSKYDYPAPEFLGELAFKVMTGRIQVKQSRGRPKQIARDNWIRQTINSVSKAFTDMHITRNEATESESVCAVIARASHDPRCKGLVEKGGLSEKAVERIWAERKSASMF